MNIDWEKFAKKLCDIPIEGWAIDANRVNLTSPQNSLYYSAYLCKLPTGERVSIHYANRNVYNDSIFLRIYSSPVRAAKIALSDYECIDSILLNVVSFSQNSSSESEIKSYHVLRDLCEGLYSRASAYNKDLAAKCALDASKKINDWLLS